MDRGGMRTFYGTAAPQRLGACRPLTTVVLTKDPLMSSIQRWENLKEGVFLPIDQRLSVHTQFPPVTILLSSVLCSPAVSVLIDQTFCNHML